MPASIQAIKDKFRVTFEHGKDHNGKRIRTYETVATKQEADKLKTEFEYKEQRYLLSSFTKMKLCELLEHWMDNHVKYNCEVTTAYGYRNVISKHLVPSIGNIEVQQLQPPNIQAYYKALMDEKGLSPNTVHRHHALLRKVLDYALKQQYVSRNVADAVAPPKKKKFTGKTYTQVQLRDLLSKAKGTKLEIPVFLAGYLGLRREEITGLRWNYVDFDNQLIHIEEVRTSAGNETVIKAPKTEKSRRTLHMVDELRDLLIAHRDSQNERKDLLGDHYNLSGYVVVRNNGNAARVNTVTEQFKDFLEKNNLPSIRLHDLRHTFSSILYSEGVDLKAISEALGHSDIGTTNRIYTHLFDKTHKSTVSVMSKALM